MGVSSLLDEKRYIGNKFGGKFLRAPEVYLDILERAGDSLTKLRCICTIEGYIHDNNTGDKYPSVPFVKSVKDINQICLTENSAKVIQYGVKEKGNSRVVSPILFPRTFWMRHLVAWNKGGFYGKEFYKIIPNQEDDVVTVAAQLNSTFGILQREIIGLVNLGEGAIKFSGDDVGMFLLFPDLSSDVVLEPFTAMATRELNEDIVFETKQKDRRELDSMLFDLMKLTKNEIDKFYEATISLVMTRKNKAGSV